MSEMTLRVYRLRPETGQRTELPHVDPSPVTLPVVVLVYPPCRCPRCVPQAKAERVAS